MFAITQQEKEESEWERERTKRKRDQEREREHMQAEATFFIATLWILCSIWLWFQHDMQLLELFADDDLLITWVARNCKQFAKLISKVDSQKVGL